MATVNKRKMAQKKAKRAQNKIKKREREDSLGISRKKRRFMMTPKRFIILKIISIVLPLFCYLVFSVGLFTCMLFSALMLIPTFLTERYHNASYIKSNHIKIPKIDSILAVIVMLLSIVGALISSNTKMKLPFMEQQSEFVQKIENVSTCLTGRRRIKFKPGKFNFKDFDFDMDMNFGTMPPPDDMPHMKPPSKFSISDLPIESLFSTIISTVTTVMIFTVPASSVLVLVVYNKRRKRFNSYMNEIVEDNFTALTDEDYYRIFTFDGVVLDDDTIEVEVDSNITNQEIIDTFKDDHGESIVESITKVDDNNNE